VVATIKFASDAVEAEVSPSEHSISRDWLFWIGHGKDTYILYQEW
jgi:hypothetical protein